MFRQLYVFKFGKELLSKKMFIKYFFPHGSENVPVWKMLNSFGKHLYFPNYPPSSFSHTVKDLQQFPHWTLTKRKILFPRDVSEDEVYDEMPLNFEEKQLGHTKIDRDIRDDDGFEWFLENKHEVFEYFRSDKAEYLDSINKMVDESHANNVTGKPFDIISLLSMSFCGNESDLVRGNGEKVEVESLRGKNILVCCTLVPTLWCLYREEDLLDLPFACSLLFSGDDYEVVMIVKMRKKWSGDEEIFNHFLSGFPSTWLAVPFFDTLRHDFICKCMNLNSDSKYLFLDQNQKVLNNPNGKLRYHYAIGDICSKTPHYELDTIFDCKPTDLISKVNPKGVDDTVSISELNERLVGLYICVNGRFLSTLKVIYEACKDRRHEFEIVLVYFPLGNGVSPQVFQVLINEVLDQMKLSGSWWIFPYDEYVCSTFWNGLNEEDRLIILGPHNKFVQPRGKDVINEFGINGYPFIQEYMVKRYLEELKALTLESLLLVHGSSDLSGTRAMRVPVAELRGKIVLLYADYIRSLYHPLYHSLLSWYFRSKMTDPKVPLDFEVVFVDLGGGNDSSLDLMPWLRCPFDPLRSAFVKNKLLNMPGLSVFGRDGQLISLHACQLLESHGPEDFLSYDGLRDEIKRHVDSVSCRCSREDMYADSLV